MARVTPLLDQFLGRARSLARWLTMQPCQVLLVLVGHVCYAEVCGGSVPTIVVGSVPSTCHRVETGRHASTGGQVRADASLAWWEGGTRILDQTLIAGAAPFAGAVGECSHVRTIDQQVR